MLFSNLQSFIILSDIYYPNVYACLHWANLNGLIVLTCHGNCQHITIAGLYIIDPPRLSVSAVLKIACVLCPKNCSVLHKKHVRELLNNLFSDGI